ncbi:hypothetical protein KEM52_003085 [Ascosphaera acerosa]|nr:hypothetical protein KEM52_003085 [Ascosphaera acerosa]
MSTNPAGEGSSAKREEGRVPEVPAAPLPALLAGLDLNEAVREQILASVMQAATEQAETILAARTPEPGHEPKGKGPEREPAEHSARSPTDGTPPEGRATRRGVRGGGGHRATAQGPSRQYGDAGGPTGSGWGASPATQPTWKGYSLSRAAPRPQELDPASVRSWKPRNVGLFHPDTFSAKGMADRYHDGDTTVYRMVTAFTMRVRTYSHTQPGSPIRNNLESLLRGRALSWWTDVVPVESQVEFATSENGLEEFCLALERRFKPTPGEAKRALAAIHYTAADARRGRSVEEYVALIRAACKAERWDVDDSYIAYTAWNQLQTRLRYFIPEPTEDMTVEEFIRILRGHETNWKDLPPEREDGTGTKVYYTRAELKESEPRRTPSPDQVSRREFDELRVLFADLLKLQKAQMAAEAERWARVDAFYQRRTAQATVPSGPPQQKPANTWNQGQRRPDRATQGAPAQQARPTGRNQAYLAQSDAKTVELEADEEDLLLLEEEEENAPPQEEEETGEQEE